MFNLPIRILHLLGGGALPVPGPLRAPAGRAAWAPPAPASHASATETASMSEHYQLELIRSYASSGFTAVVTINSGALIAGLSRRQTSRASHRPPSRSPCSSGRSGSRQEWPPGERRTGASWPWPHRIGGSKCTGEASPRGCSTSLWACSCSACGRRPGARNLVTCSPPTTPALRPKRPTVHDERTAGLGGKADAVVVVTICARRQLDRQRHSAARSLPWKTTTRPGTARHMTRPAPECFRPTCWGQP